MPSTVPRRYAMTLLRQRMLQDMQIRNLADNTQKSYLLQVSSFARHFRRSPELLGPEEIRAWLVPLREERPPSLESIPSLKQRTILMSAYAAGLRVSEVVHLKVTDIDSQRMVIRVNQGKNRKDRYVMLSPRLLEILRLYWHDAHPREWLFPGDIPGHPITRSAVALACRNARQRSGIQKPITPHSLRHAFATHLLETGTDVRRIQLLMGHRSMSTTARYLKRAPSTLCATPSPFDLLPPPEPVQPPPSPPDYF